MVTEAKSVGEIFRARREEKKLSLKEVESATSIRTTYLDAIEEGRLDKFLSHVYLFGFMRQYALFLGLDVERLSREYPDVFKPSKEKHDFAYGIGTLEMRPSGLGSVKGISAFIWGLGAFVVLLIAIWLSKKLGLL